MDRPTGQVIRSYERSHPGELVPRDIKKDGKVPPGGGWRVHSRGSAKAKRARRRKRLDYIEADDNETAGGAGGTTTTATGTTPR